MKVFINVGNTMQMNYCFLHTIIKIHQIVTALKCPNFKARIYFGNYLIQLHYLKDTETEGIVRALSRINQIIFIIWVH